MLHRTMQNDPLQRYEARKRTREPFTLRSGYEVRVHTRFREGDKERTQVFEGIVTAMAGGGLGKTFTVRRVTHSVGVERIFPMFSPLVTDVEIVRATKVRRAKLTYLRKVDVRKRRKEDMSLMRKVSEERLAKQRSKEETERKAREERAAVERAATETAEKKAAQQNEATEKPAQEAEKEA